MSIDRDPKQRFTQHATFAIERHYPASPARVFGAWAEPTAKARWFKGPAEWRSDGHVLEFKVGGREYVRTAPVDGGVAHVFDARYHDIVAEERIIYSYDMHIGDARISVSLATVEFQAVLSGTRLVFTEQVVFLDGYDDAGSRERGTRSLLDKLGASLI